MKEQKFKHDIINKKRTLENQLKNLNSFLKFDSCTLELEYIYKNKIREIENELEFIYKTCKEFNYN